MFISHLLVAPLLFHRYFPSKVGPTTLAMASVAPAIVLNLYSIMMELIRVMFKQRVEIHDHTKPPGWIELGSGKPLGIGEWMYSLRGAMWLAGSLSLLTGLYHATRKQTHLKSPPTTPPSTQATTAKIGDKIAPPEVSPWGTIALMGSPHVYRAMLAIGLAVMSHIFLNTVGENPKALLRPFSSANSQYPVHSPTWTLAIDFLLSLLTTYLYTLNPHMSPQSRNRLAGLVALLLVVEGKLYLSHPSLLTTTTTAPATSPDVAEAWWSLTRHVCGATLVGGVLQSIPRHLGMHLGDAGMEGEGVGEMLRRGMETLKEEVCGVEDLPSLPLTPCGVKICEIEKVEQGTVEEALSGEKDQEKEKGQEQHRGVKRDSGFGDYGIQRTGAQGRSEMEHVGAGEGGRDTKGAGTLPGGRVQLSSSSTGIPHQEKRRERISHGTYAEAVQNKGHPEDWDDNAVVVDEPGGAAGTTYSYGQGLPGAGGGRRGVDSGTRKAYIH